jgi:hypothetical protein
LSSPSGGAVLLAKKKVAGCGSAANTMCLSRFENWRFPLWEACAAHSRRATKDKTGNRALFVGEDRREKQAEILT